VYRDLQDHAPVYQDPLTGAYVVTRWSDVCEIFRNPAVFSARAHRVGAVVAARRAGVDPGEPRRTAIVTDDDPYHAVLRGLIGRSYTPRRVEALDPVLCGIVDELLEDVVADQPVDIAAALADLPVRSISHILGVEPKWFRSMKEWSDGFLSPDPSTHEPAVAHFTEYFLSLIEARRADPADDLVTTLARATVDDNPLPDDEIVAVLMQQVVAGSETTLHLITNMLDLLIAHPDLWARARSDRSRVPLIIEESLRLESPTQWMPRRALDDLTVAGVQIPKGSLVLPMMGAANRDPREFERADSFDIDREPHVNLAFGLGIHYCAGAPLARAETRVALNRLLDRFSSIERAGEPRLSMVFLGNRGYDSMPVIFRA
jgi:cytochrome P450